MDAFCCQGFEIRLATVVYFRDQKKKIRMAMKMQKRVVIKSREHLEK
jgi:hypothetical protein